MPIYKFGRNDIFYNRVITHPKSEFILYNNEIFYNRKPSISGTHVSNAGHINTGYISLYEVNVDRKDGQLIYPFVTKDGTRNAFRTVTTTNFNSDFAFGDKITGSYPLSSSFTRTYFSAGETSFRREALRNTINHYSAMGAHYQFSSSARDLTQVATNMIDIPSIFYGSSIKRGSVDLKYYLTGALIGQVQDENNDGALVQIGPSGSPGSGSVVGLVLYNEGFIILTGSTDLSNSSYTEDYIAGASSETPQWIHFSAHQAVNATSSYIMAFSGTMKTPVIAMLAHAHKDKLNFSNNPTYLDYAHYQSTGTISSRKLYREAPVPIVNVVSSSYYEYDAPFAKTTYISKIGIYDEQRNLIAIAKLAKPVRKTADVNYTFKLKLDM